MSLLALSRAGHARSNHQLGRFPQYFIFARSTPLPIRSVPVSAALPVHTWDDRFNTIPKKKSILDDNRTLNFRMRIVESLKHDCEPGCRTSFSSCAITPVSILTVK